MQQETRRDRILNTLLTTRSVLLVLVILGLIPSVLSYIINRTTSETSLPAWWEGWLQNFSTEMFGALFTFILLELIIAGRQRQAERHARMERQQVNDLGQLRIAQTNDDKQSILERMQTDDLIQNVDLSTLNLERIQLSGANFRGCNLSRTVLSYSNLENTSFNFASMSGATANETQFQGASFNSANLENVVLLNANLYLAKMENANLWGAILRNADLRHANLQKANLWGADLRGAKLIDADLRGANLNFTIMDRFTILPDGNVYNRQNLNKFTQ